MAHHIMIDMETLGTVPSSVILTIGAVTFDPRGKGIIDRLELRPTIDEQTEKYNRFMNEDTINWWSKQSPEAVEEALGDKDRTSFRDCMEKLQKFCWNKQAIWANGSCFDVVVAESAFRDLDMRIPWDFWTIRDCRTIYDIAGVSLRDSKYGSKTTHRAIEDAIHQAVVIQDAYRKLLNAGLTHIK